MFSGSQEDSCNENSSRRKFQIRKYNQHQCLQQNWETNQSHCTCKEILNNLKVRLEGKTAALGALKVGETVMAECILIKAAQASLKSQSDYQQLVSQLCIVERDGVLSVKVSLAMQK